MTRTPVCVTIVATFLWMATLIAVFLAITLLAPGTPADKIWRLNPLAYEQFKTFGGVSVALLLAVAVIAATAAVGLAGRKKWAWWLALGIFAVNGAGDIVSFVMTRNLVRSGLGVLVAVCFLFFLTRRSVRSFYQQPV
jgi:hypothetical protein